MSKEISKCIDKTIGYDCVIRLQTTANVTLSQVQYYLRVLIVIQSLFSSSGKINWILLIMKLKLNTLKFHSSDFWSTMPFLILMLQLTVHSNFNQDSKLWGLLCKFIRIGILIITLTLDYRSDSREQSVHQKIPCPNPRQEILRLVRNFEKNKHAAYLPAMHQLLHWHCYVR